MGSSRFCFLRMEPFFRSLSIVTNRAEGLVIGNWPKIWVPGAVNRDDVIDNGRLS